MAGQQSTQPISFDAPLKQATTIPVPAGVTFDSPLTSPVTVPSDSETTQPSSPPPPQSGNNEGFLSKAADAAGNVIEGAAKSAYGTISGTDDWARKHLPAVLTNSDFGFGPPANLQHVHAMATPQGIAQHIGAGIEDIGEFLLGDETLKGLSVSERLLKASKAADAIESSPVLTRIFNAGVRAIRSGAVGTAQGAIKSDGDTGTALASGFGAGIANAVIPEATDAIQAARNAIPGAVDTIRTAIRPGAIQETFQGEIRKLINDAAQEYGISPSSASSIRDVAKQVSDSLLQRARQAYQAMDEASGGRVQRTADAIKNVQQKIRELNGIDPDQEGAFIEKLNDLEGAHEQIMAEMEEAGVPRSLLDEANAVYRKSKAMLDFSRAVRSSSEGLRPELAAGAKKPVTESLNPGKLFARVNKLYDSGRLQDALGQSRAAQLLRAVNDAHISSQLAQSWRGIVKKYGGYAAAGALPFGGYELVKHLLGD